jgi:hypothetical protein
VFLEERRVASVPSAEIPRSDQLYLETGIGTMQRDHPELRLTIEGHTGDVGDDAFNNRALPVLPGYSCAPPYGFARGRRRRMR